MSSVDYSSWMMALFALTIATAAISRRSQPRTQSAMFAIMTIAYVGSAMFAPMPLWVRLSLAVIAVYTGIVSFMRYRAAAGEGRPQTH